MTHSNKLNCYYYKNNDDVIITVAQCADFICEHAGDLVGRVVGDKPREIHTEGITITIDIMPAEIPRITLNKTTLMPIVLPFSEDE